MQPLFQETGCGVCSYPSGFIGTCCCRADCGDGLCRHAPLPVDSYSPPPVPRFR